MTKRADLGRKTLFLCKLVHFAEHVERWSAQSENDKTWWSRAENAVLYKRMHLAEKS